jgi:TPP-dependent pyruvate/acetoin dehydrogenase alpha subunit
MHIEESLKTFEKKVIALFEQGKARCPIHLCGGNEKQLLSIFSNIKAEDYVFSTHRNHYHYLLKGGDEKALLDELMGLPTGVCKGNARSMNICDPSINFYTSAIVGGNCAIAVGVGLALKKKESTAHIWCFLGDGAEDQGHFIEAARFSYARRLPLTFIIEDNDASVNSTKEDRWHNYPPIKFPNVLRYSYKREYPHVGIGKHVTF